MTNSLNAQQTIFKIGTCAGNLVFEPGKTDTKLITNISKRAATTLRKNVGLVFIPLDFVEVFSGP